MGEAKRRGSFEARKQQAIEADRQIKTQQAAEQPLFTRRKRGSSQLNLIVAAALAAGATRSLK